MITVKNLCFSYRVQGRVLPAFADLSASFVPGAITAIVGPSGCGKTSLLRVLASLNKPDAGAFCLNDAQGDDAKAIAAMLQQGARTRQGAPRVSIIFQDYGLLPWKTLRANVELPLRLAGMDSKERARRVDPILEELGLAPFAALFPSRLSGGMKQRAAIAQALAAQSDILLMDEPFSSLDAITRESMHKLLLRVQARHKTTVIIVTHSIEEAIALASSVYVMGGRNPGRFVGMVDIDPASKAIRGRAACAVATTLQAMLAQGMVAADASGASQKGRAHTASCAPADAPDKAPSPAGRLLRMALAACVILGLWAGLAAILARPFLPAPALALGRLWQRLADGSLLVHIGSSAWRVFLSLIVFGPAAWTVGLCAGRSKKLDSLLSPFVYLLHPLPKVAFLPILLLFFGLGNASKVALMGLVIFGQLFVEARDAAKSIPATLLDSVRALGYGTASLVRHVILPGTWPELFSALRVSLGTAIAVLFLSETFASIYGLGGYIMDAWSRVDYPDMYAAIVALSLFGLALYLLVDALEAILCPWQRP